MSSYALQLPESLKRASKRIAAADDTTMNQFFVVAIAEKISAMETADFFQRRSPPTLRSTRLNSPCLRGKNLKDLLNSGMC